MKPAELTQAALQGYSDPPSTARRLFPSHDLAAPSSLGTSYIEAPGINYHLTSSGQQPLPRVKNNPPTISKPPLKSHHSYPSLKRSYQAYEQAQYSYTAPEFYDVTSEFESQRKPTMHPDHRLLSFGQTQTRHIILDRYGRPGTVEITAQIHGMFFLSEIATNFADTIIMQPELTCYRRNLFQISGSVTSPNSPISVFTKEGQTMPIVSKELCISATESVDGHVIRLIVIPWKTPPPNSPEVPPNLEQEPQPIILDDNVDSSQEINNEITIQTVAWRRLQFRVATANNGRRKELQQHFVLRLNLIATLADNTKQSIVEASTAPIVVRGRSPRNFQARKEIPLVGSSASSRGQTTQSSPAENKATFMPDKSQNQQSQNVDLSRLPFKHHINNFPPSPQLLHSGFNQWTTSQVQMEQATTTTSTPEYHSPQAISQGYPQTNQQASDMIHLNALPSSQLQLPFHERTTRRESNQMVSTLNLSSQSAQFMDSNPRPAKITRNVPTSKTSNLQYNLAFEERQISPYSALSSESGRAQRSRDYCPVTMEPESWGASENFHIAYSTSMPSQQHFMFSSQSFSKDEQLPGNHTWSAA